MELNELDLGRFGAMGFSLRDRLDMSGHRAGRTDPHVNSEVVQSETEDKVARDLAANQLDGFNGMQNGW